MIKTKSFLSVLLVFVLLSLFPAFPVSAEEQPQGKYELTATFTSTNQQITHEWYDSMDELWSELGPVAASDRITEIKMYADWDINEEKDLSHYSCDVTLDLNGHNIIRHTKDGKQVGNGGVFRVASNAHLTIKDSNPGSEGYDGIKGGVITGGASTNGGGAFTITYQAKLTFAGGTVYRCSTNEHGGAVMITGEGSKRPAFEMKGGRIYFCKTTGALSNCHGGAIYADNADVALSDCRIDSCYSEDNGGAVYMNGGAFRANNVIFTGNHCLDYGGAIYISGGSLSVTGGRFATNEAKNDGGAVYVDADEGAKFSNCIFSRNKSLGGAGGAVYVNDIGTFLVDTDVIANASAGFGGGVYVDSRYDIGVKGLVRIYDNSGKNSRNNLTLQDGFASRAYLTDGGLYEGSKIGLSSTGKNVQYAEEFSVYHLDYVFSDTGDVVIYNHADYEREAPMLASALSGKGSVWVIIGLSALAACGIAACVLIRKKKKAKEERGK